MTDSDRELYWAMFKYSVIVVLAGTIVWWVALDQATADCSRFRQAPLRSVPARCAKEFLP